MTCLANQAFLLLVVSPSKPLPVDAAEARPVCGSLLLMAHVERERGMRKESLVCRCRRILATPCRRTRRASQQ